jgi:septal ring factor EnvC (AmiA/AmiB activator)
MISIELKDQLRELLKSEYSDAHFVEVTTSQAIAERLYSWAKLFGAVVAVPLAIAVFLLGIAGFHTYSDFAKQVKTAQADVETKIRAAQAAASNLQSESASLTKDYDKLNADLKVSAGKANQINDRYKIIEASLNDTEALADRTEALATKVSRLDNRVTGIEDSIKSVLAVGNADYINYPKLNGTIHDALAVKDTLGKIGLQDKFN